MISVFSAGSPGPLESITPSYPPESTSSAVVKAGSTVGVYLLLDDMTIQNYMMVEEVTHTYSLDKHVMDLTLIGGEFVG